MIPFGESVDTNRSNSTRTQQRKLPKLETTRWFNSWSLLGILLDKSTNKIPRIRETADLEIFGTM